MLTSQNEVNFFLFTPRFELIIAYSQESLSNNDFWKKNDNFNETSDKCCDSSRVMEAGVCFRVASSTRAFVKSHSTTGNLVEKLFLLLQQWSSAMSSPRYGFYVHFGASVIDSSEISHSLSRFSSCMIFHRIYHQRYFFLM